MKRAQESQGRAPLSTTFAARDCGWRPSSLHGLHALCSRRRLQLKGLGYVVVLLLLGGSLRGGAGIGWWLRAGLVENHAAYQSPRRVEDLVNICFHVTKVVWTVGDERRLSQCAD